MTTLFIFLFVASLVLQGMMVKSIMNRLDRLEKISQDHLKASLALPDSLTAILDPRLQKIIEESKVQEDTRWSNMRSAFSGPGVKKPNERSRAS